MDHVWTRINDELTARRVSWASFARDLGISDQVANNWSRRGVPPARYADCARALGWSTDRLLGLEDDRGSALQVKEPSAPYHTHEITDSEWSYLDNLRMARPKERDRLIADAEAAAEEAKAIRREVLESLGLPGEAPPGTGNNLPVAPRTSPAPAPGHRLVRVAKPAEEKVTQTPGKPLRPASRYVATDKVVGGKQPTKSDPKSEKSRKS